MVHNVDFVMRIRAKSTKCSLATARPLPPPYPAAVDFDVRAYAAAIRGLDSCQGVRMRGPSAVTAIVNSKCAATDPSCE